MENSFKSIVDQARSILILLPQKPFFDQVAGGVSLFLALRDEKEVQVSCPSPMIVEFNRIVGVNKISEEVGNKNMIIKFIDYKASDIERVSYDIENSQFRLTIIPKSRILPPEKSQLDVTYSGVSADTVILIGGTNETHFPAISSKDLSVSKLVHLGIKDLSLGNRSFSSFSRPASSVSEVVLTLIKELKDKIDEDIATNLLMGIETATASFSDPSVSAETFAIISELMRGGGKRISTQSVSQLARNYQSFSPQSAMPKANISNQVSSSFSQTPVQNPESQKEEEQPPQDWLRPKIFKGSSVS